MDENTLLPVRIKKRGDHVVGNEAKTLTRDSSGFTKTIVAATAASIIQCPSITNRDIHKVAGAIDGDYLTFDSYEEEVNSRYGRPVIQIVMEEGEEAYDEIKDVFSANPYLHAAVKEIPVWDAIQELDCDYNMIVPYPREPENSDADTEKKLGASYSAPDVVSTAIVGGDGEIYERDLREFVPELEWVVEHWRITGGNRRHAMKVSNTEEDQEVLEELSLEGVEGEIADSYIRQVDRSVTIHHIKEKEESITDDEDDRFAMRCGSSTRASKNLTRLRIDTGRVEATFHCGNCRKHVDVAEPDTVEV